MKYIAYRRVSTKKQGTSGLGLEAQEAAIQQIIKPEDEILFSFTEAESGKNDKRPELLKAIAACKLHGATLLIAKLDRLSRNASFLFTLRDSGLKLCIADMPQADEFMIGIMAVIADWEGKRIRTRIKEALNAKRSRGEKMGTVANLTGRTMGNVANKQKFIERLKPYKSTILYFIKEGWTNDLIFKRMPEFHPDFKRPFLDRAVKHVRKEYDETQLLLKTPQHTTPHIWDFSQKSD